MTNTIGNIFDYFFYYHFFITNSVSFWNNIGPCRMILIHKKNKSIHFWNQMTSTSFVTVFLMNKRKPRYRRK